MGTRGTTMARRLPSAGATGIGGRATLWLAGGATALLATSCLRLRQFAVDRADRAAYRIIAATQRQELGSASLLAIAPGPDDGEAGTLAGAGRVEGSEDAAGPPGTLLLLSDALGIAVGYSRDYQRRRESLYEQALRLTEVRRDYGRLFSAEADTSLSRSDVSDEAEWFGGEGISGTMSKLLADGARITVGLSHRLTRFYSSDSRPSGDNTLSFAVVQPLLRNAGSLVNREGLVQGERDMVYAVREFRRFQQDFVIDVASRYYSLLSLQDQLRNAVSNHRRADDNWRKIERLSGGGRKSDLEVDQARQKVLEAEDNLVRTRKDYGRQLDGFKLFLGIPIDLDVGPDPRELERVAERGLLRPDLNLTQAVRAALESRLDLKTAQDLVEDRRRGVEIAYKRFFPTLDASYEFSSSSAGKEYPALPVGDRSHRWSLNLGVPFDWTPRRNDYRRSLISREQAERDLELFRDQLVLQVRDSWRALEEARANHRIQQEGVRLAERRVKSSSLWLQRGRATARDLLEAEDALLASQNALTSALIRHTIQRLRFWNAVERFEVDDRGLWSDDAGAEGAAVEAVPEPRPESGDAGDPGRSPDQEQGRTDE